MNFTLTPGSSSPPSSSAPEPLPGPTALPYKFLDYFEERDARSFAGRDSDIAEMLSRITANRTLVLFARSGWGKTSMLKAGVFPKLREGGFHPVYVRTLTEPIADLREALTLEARALGVEPDGLGDLPPAEAIRRLIAALGESGAVVLVLDQFEEIFTLFRRREGLQAAFIEVIGALIEDHALRLRVVFSLREDFLAELESFRRRLPDLLESRYRLGPLTAFGAREAIVRPLRRHGIAFSQALVARLLDILAVDGFEPPMLQIVCTEVYREAVRRDPESVRLTTDDLDKVGGIEGIFSRYLDGVTTTIPDEKLLLSRMVLDTLITQEGTKRAVTAAKLSIEGRFRANLEEIEDILGTLAGLRLLRPELRGDATWYELIHEKLVVYVKSWVTSDQAFSNFLIARDLIANGSRGGLFRTQPGALLNLGQVDDVVGPYRERLRVDPIEAEYLVRSAIFTGSESSSYWASRYELPASIEILLSDLGHEDSRFRLGAARAAGTFADPDGRISAATLALGSDPSVEVRQAAGASLARLRRSSKATTASKKAGIHLEVFLSAASAMPTLGPPGSVLKDIGLLNLIKEILKAVPWVLASARNAIGRRGLLDAVSTVRRDLWDDLPQLDMLATMVESGDSLAGFSFWQRLRARRLAASRSRERYAESIKAQRRVGAITGVAAGAAWGLTVGAAFLGFQALVHSYNSSAYESPLATIVAVLVLVALPAFWCALGGGLFGWIAAGTAAMEAIHGDEGFHPLRIAVRSKLFLIVLSLLGVSSLIEIRPSFSDLLLQVSSSLAIIAGIAAAIAITLEGLSLLAVRCAGGRGHRALWIWTMLVSISLPFAGSTATNLFVFRTYGRWSWLYGYIAAAISYLVATIAIPRWYAARRAEALPPNPTPGSRASRRARAIVLGGAAGALVLFSVGWGFDSLPIFARLYGVWLSPNEPTDVSSTLGPARPDTAFLVIRADRDVLCSVSSSSIPPELIVKAGGQSRILGDHQVDELPTPGSGQVARSFLLVPAGRHPMEIILEDTGDTSTRLVTYDIRLHPIAIPDGVVVESDPDKLPQLVSLRLVRSPKPAPGGGTTWTARLRGSEPADHRGGVEVNLLRQLPFVVGLAHLNPKNYPTAELRIVGGSIQVPGKGGKANLNLRLEPPVVPIDIGPGDGQPLVIVPEVRRGRWELEIDLTTAQGVDPASMPRALLAWVVLSPDSTTSQPGLTEYSPSDVESANRRVDQLLRIGRKKDAVRICREAIAANPGAAGLHERLGSIFAQEGDPGSASAEYLEASEIDPNNSAFANESAWNLCLCGRFAEAYPAASRANRLKPDNPDYLDTLAHAAFGTGRWEEAVRAWDRLERIAPGYSVLPSHTLCDLDSENRAEAIRRRDLDRGFPAYPFTR